MSGLDLPLAMCVSYSINTTRPIGRAPNAPNHASNVHVVYLFQQSFVVKPKKSLENDALVDLSEVKDPQRNVIAKVDPLERLVETIKLEVDELHDDDINTVVKNAMPDAVLTKVGAQLCSKPFVRLSEDALVVELGVGIVGDSPSQGGL